jgi:hypothetical protein
LPIFNKTSGYLSLGTVHASNPVLKRLYIRPTRAWAPHYEEDTDFQACAPQASPSVDPPLHFSKDPTTGNVSWCAESYPSQNDNVGDLDRRSSLTGNYPGLVIPYTSHVVKNSSSATCTATPLTSIANLGTAYPSVPAGASCPAAGGASSSASAANHPPSLIIDVNGANNVCADHTCDRTVLYRQDLSWTRFPLLARPSQVESAISADSTYNCTLTYDNGGLKTGKSTPAQGCCGLNTNVWSGFTNLPAVRQSTSAHLEPDVPCLVPTY